VTFVSETLAMMVNNPLIYQTVLSLLAAVEFKRDFHFKVKGLEMYSNTPDRLLATFLWKISVLENFETHFLKKFVRPGMSVVDIGANIGYYTLLLSQLVGRDGSVTAFEPDPNNYRLLLKNIVFNRVKTSQLSKKPSPTKMATHACF